VAFAYLLIDYLNKKDRLAEELQQVVVQKPKVRVIVRGGQAVPVGQREEEFAVVSAEKEAILAAPSIEREEVLVVPVKEKEEVVSILVPPREEAVAVEVKEAEPVHLPDKGLYIPPEYRIEKPVEASGPLIETRLPKAPVKKIVLPSMPENTPVLMRAPSFPVKQMPRQPIVPLPTPERKKPPRHTGPKLVTPRKEDQTSVAYIGYNPINVFEQTEPLTYPYVQMPKPGSVIKFARRGKTKQRGLTEEGFRNYLAHYFGQVFQVYDDRFVLTKRSYQPFEPDLIMVDERNGLNLFMDIEIDEPYEDNNVLSKRELKHYQYADVNTNRALVNRGWVVIRFAEIQVHQHPESCCLFIAHVIKSIFPSFEIPELLLESTPLTPLKQWTKAEAREWSLQKHREDYLGITSFESLREARPSVPIRETQLGREIEKKVLDEEPYFEPEPLDVSTPAAITALIHSVIENNQCMAFTYEDKPCLIKPWIVVGNRLKAYCYIKNENREFDISLMKETRIKEKPFIVEAKGPAVGIEKMRYMVCMAIQYHRFVRIRYTRANWTTYLIDEQTGDVILDEAEAAESIHTISHPGLTGKTFKEYALPEPSEGDSLKAWCHKTNWQEAYLFNRICEMAVLNL
jgi:hypothetical protein